MKLTTIDLNSDGRENIDNTISDLQGKATAVDAAFFYEMQPNYSRPRLQDIWAKSRFGISVIDMDMLIGRSRERKKERMQEDSVDGQELREVDFLIACPTVCCLHLKVWVDVRQYRLENYWQ